MMLSPTGRRKPDGYDGHGLSTPDGRLNVAHAGFTKRTTSSHGAPSSASPYAVRIASGVRNSTADAASTTSPPTWSYPRTVTWLDVPGTKSFCRTTRLMGSIFPE